jgi:acyl phosphate:glycerol-3-phosphate acyltransferase
VSDAEEATLSTRRLARLVLAYLVGAVPFSNLLARRRAGVDLRHIGSGTVSGTSLYQVGGFNSLALAGVLDIAKGASATLAARLTSTEAEPRPRTTRWREPTPLEAAAAGLVVTGHNWSPYLDGAGGRGIAPSIGAYLVVAPEGAVLMLGGLTIGRLAHHSGIGTLLGQLAVIPVLRATRGPRGSLAGAAVVTPMLLKRLAGNSRPARRTPAVYAARLIFDRDTWSSAEG